MHYSGLVTAETLLPNHSAYRLSRLQYLHSLPRIQCRQPAVRWMATARYIIYEPWISYRNILYASYIVQHNNCFQAIDFFIVSCSFVKPQCHSHFTFTRGSIHTMVKHFISVSTRLMAPQTPQFVAEALSTSFQDRLSIYRYCYVFLWALVMRV
jgi:hypothetical protein